MELILLILMATGGLALLAKKARKRRRFNLRPVRITTEKVLGTLASDTALVQTLTGTSANAYRCVSVAVVWSIRELTEGEGPLTVGYAHSDYSVAEIKECLESQTAIDQGDKVAQERANRLVRSIGQLGPEGNETLNDGLPVKTKLNWKIGIGDSVNAFIFNEDDAANLTTGANVNLSGTMWVRD